MNNPIESINNVLRIITSILTFKPWFTIPLILYILFELSLYKKGEKLLTKRLYENSKVFYGRMKVLREKYHAKYPRIRKKLKELDEDK